MIDMNPVYKLLIIYILIPLLIAGAILVFAVPKIYEPKLKQLSSNNSELITENAKIKRQYDDTVKQKDDYREANTALTRENGSLKGSIETYKNELKKRQTDRTTVKEKFNEGKLVERVSSTESTKVDSNKSEGSHTTVTSSKSVEIAVKTDTSTSVSSESHSVGKVDIQNANKPFGVGPVAWVSLEGLYLGLDYRLYTVPVVDMGLDAVVGINPNLSSKSADFGAGLMISKEMSPRLNLGIVGYGNINKMTLSAGVGMSYLF